MEEPATWKGHSFTLLVFGGIVVLCSIFFILGMLVGRDQGRRIAELEAAEIVASASLESQPETPQLSFFSQTTEDEPELALEPPPPTLQPSPAPDPEPPAPPAKEKHFLQIFATLDSRNANRVLEKVKSEGFRALILPPPPDEKDGYYRVQVGPYDSIAEADVAKKDLQMRGYKDAHLKE